MARERRRRPDQDVEEAAATQEPQPLRKDRREHGGMAPRPDDEELAERTEQERVDLGLDDYDPNSVPPATDDPVPVDFTQSDVYRQEVEEIDREIEEGSLPTGERPEFPPTRYPER